jgi:hypothetical protein
MPDIKIFIVAVIWVTLAVFIMSYASGNFISADASYINASGLFSGTVHMGSQTTQTLNYQNIRGDWANDNEGLKPVKLDWLTGHASCYFGSKQFLTGVFSERIHVKDLMYNDTIKGDDRTDEISLNVYYTSCGAVELRIKGDNLYYAYTPYNINSLIASTPISMDWKLTYIANVNNINNATWIGYDFFVENMTTIVKVWSDFFNESTCYSVPIVDWRVEKNFEDKPAYKDNYGLAYAHMVQELNGTKLSRIDTNTLSMTIDYYTHYANVDVDDGIEKVKQYNLANTQGIYNNLINALTFQVDSRVIPLEYQFFLLGIPYIILAIWIIAFAKELTQV